MKQLEISDLLKIQRPSELNLDSLQYIIKEINNPDDELKINAIKELLANFDIPKDVSTKQLGILIQYWIDTDRSSFNEVSTGISLNSLDLEILIDNYEKRESEIKKTITNAGTAVNNARRRQEQLFEEAKKIKGQVEKAKEVERKINNQKIYANVEVPEIPKIDAAEVKKTVEILENSEEELKNVLIQNGFAKDDQEASILAKAYIADISKKAAQPEISYFAPIQTAVLHKISTDKSFISKVLQQDDLVIEAKKGSTLLAINARAEDYLFKKITESILNNKYSTYLYGPDSINVNFSDEKDPNSNIEIDLKAIISNSIILQEKRYLEIERIDTNQEPRALLTTITTRYVESKNDKQTNPKVKVSYLEEFRKRIRFNKDKQDIFGSPLFNSEWVNIIFETDSNLKVLVEPAKQITSTNSGIVQILEIKNLTSNNSTTTSGVNEISKAAVKTGIKESITALFASIGMALGPLGAILIGALSWIGAEVVSKLAQWIKKNPEVAGLIFGGLSFFGILPLFGPLIALGVASIIVAGTIGVGITTAAVFGTLNLVRFVWSRIVISLAGPMFVLFVVVPILTVFILFIINSGAYIVPQKTIGTEIIDIPPGGNLVKCDSTKTGTDITQQLASSIRSGSVLLLPNSLGSRQEGLCITPTMIILHTSSGYDNDDGNIRTYETLVSRNVSCQLSTDTNDTILMLNFFEKQVENAWCADNLNAGGVSIEMSGEPDSGFGPYSKCAPTGDQTFTPNGPHPCPDLEDLSFDAICKIMQKYKIPWTQIFQHEASNGTHVDPNGDAWVDKFILRLKNNCQI